MALFRGTLRSAALRMDTNVSVILPCESNLAHLAPLDKTVILLHGLKQNSDSWVRMSRVERFAALTGFNVIMPEVQRGWYTNMAEGIDYFDYVAKEIPEICGRMFNIPTDGGHLYTAGLSMGGYGALKIALSLPESYAGAMSYSGALACLEYPEYLVSEVPLDEMRAVIGQELKCRDEERLSVLAERAAASGHRPRLYVACGTEDGLIEQNRDFCKTAKALGFDLTEEEWPGGHEWAFWDEACARSFSLMAGLDPAEVIAKA